MHIYLESLDAWGNPVWPDGRPLLDQPTKLIRAFGIIGREVRRYREGK